MQSDYEKNRAIMQRLRRRAFGRYKVVLHALQDVFGKAESSSVAEESLIQRVDEINALIRHADGRFDLYLTTRQAEEEARRTNPDREKQDFDHCLRERIDAARAQKSPQP